MVSELKQADRVIYQCDACKFKYPTRELAERCQAWCSEHQSCNLEIIKHAVQDEQT